MVWPFGNNSQNQQATGALPLGSNNMGMGQPMGMGMGMGMGPQQTQFAQTQQGFGAQPYGYAPPPSEMELISALIQTSVPFDRWLAGPVSAPGGNLQALSGLIANIVSLSVHHILSNSSLKEAEDGSMKFDFSAVSPLPSADSVTMNSQQLQNSASAAVQESMMKQQQIASMMQSTAMQGALAAAMDNPGALEKAGGALGGLMRGVVGLPQGGRVA